MQVCVGALCTRLNLFGSSSFEETIAEVGKEAATGPSFRFEKFFSLMGDVVWPFSTPISAVLLVLVAWFLAFAADRLVGAFLDLTLLIQQAPAAAAASKSSTPSKQKGLHNGTLLFHGRSTNHVQFTSCIFGMTRNLAISARVYLGLLFADWIMDHVPVSAVSRIFHPTTIAVNSTPASATATAAAAATTTASSSSSTLSDYIRLSDSALNIAIVVWCCLTLAAFKRYFLFHCLPTSPRRLGRITLLDRILDIVTFSVGVLAILAELSIDSTLAIHAVLSAGGVGALIFSLASKDLATEIVGGVALNVWNAIDVGDRVRLLDGTTGKVIEIGLVETLIQGFDNIITRIPNSQLTKSRFSNLSRTPRSRLKQYLRFKHSDIDKLPSLLDDIKEEMKLACPKLVHDGSKSFHAVLTSFEADHVQAMILAHFDIAPATGEFTRNRHAVMFAIVRAMKKHGVEFAMPSIVYRTAVTTATCTTIATEATMTMAAESSMIEPFDGEAADGLDQLEVAQSNSY